MLVSVADPSPRVVVGKPRAFRDRDRVDAAKAALMSKKGWDEGTAYRFIRQKSMELRKPIDLTAGELLEECQRQA